MDKHEGPDGAEINPESENSTSAQLQQTIAPLSTQKYILRAQTGQYWAELEFLLIWATGGQTCVFRTVSYTALDNDEKWADAAISVFGGTFWFKDLPDFGWQDGENHLFEVSGSVITPNRSVKVQLYWRYKRNNVSDVTLQSELIYYYVPVAPKIDPISQTDTLSFKITGIWAESNDAVLTVYSSNELIATGKNLGNGRWEAMLEMPPSGTLTFHAKQTLNGQISPASSSVTVTLHKFASIIQPAEGATVRIENLVFTGTTTSGYNIVVVRSDDHWQGLTDSKAEPSGSWTRRLLSTVMLPSADLKVEAQYKLGNDHGYSPVRTIKVQSYPIIQTPDAVTEQPTTFTVKGTGGRPGATLYIQKDQFPSTVYGTTAVNSQNWSVQATLPPGRQTVTAEQVMGGVRSKPGVPRTYRVKPDPVTDFAAAVDDDSNLTLSGRGYKGAEVVIHLTDVSVPIATTTVRDSSWSTVIKDWLPGIYRFDVKQRVPDSAGGWIESLWGDRLSLTVPVPQPKLNVEVSPEGIPRFYGTAKFWPNDPAQVEVRIYNTDDPIVPIVLVERSGTWSSTALQPWEPKTYQVVVRLGVGGQWSLPTSPIPVIIPVPRPLPPTINPVEDNGLSPRFGGTCAANATVTLTFTFPPTTPENATVSGTTWSHQRALPFTAGVQHSVSATQTLGGNPSLPITRPFTLTEPTPQPTITYPPSDEETDSDLTVTGDNGKAGASMQLWDARDEKPLGNPVILTQDGVWSISLNALGIDTWFISARQTYNNRPSEHSDIREFKVVVLPPEFVNPPPSGGDLPRTSTLSGKGRPNGEVTVWRKGNANPVLVDLLINPSGIWEGKVAFDVGEEVFWAIQTYDGKTSKSSPEVPCRFVPHAVLPESPIPEEPLGNTVIVSGFGVADDTITLKRGATVLGQTTVLPDRTWSINAVLAPPEGAVTLSIVASKGEFHSAVSEWVGQLGLYLPQFTKPVAGQWGSPAMTFAGQGNPGTGSVMSWYSPDVVLVESVPVTSDGWVATSTVPLAESEHWCRFRQTFSTGTTISDCSESERFDVRVESPDKP